MTDNQIDGVSINGETLWIAQQLKEHDCTWIGTCRNMLLIRHIDAQSVLEFYINQCPETDMIRSIIDNNYHNVILSQIPGKSKLQILIDELGFHATIRKEGD